jgi:protein arginine kinase
MVAGTLLEHMPPWLTESGAAEGVVMGQCTLARNLSDYPFPGCCSREEQKSIEDRIAHVFNTHSLFSNGQYYTLSAMTWREIRFLAERQLITRDLMRGSGARGVYISGDQRLAIMVNGRNHLSIRLFTSGLQLQEAWNQLNVIDDTLNGMLDFAWNDRLGFLTSTLNLVGTGLKCAAMLHLPALVITGKLAQQAANIVEQRMLLRGIQPEKGLLEIEEAETAVPASNQSIISSLEGPGHCDFSESAGELFMIANQGTLGVSEEEIVFQVRQLAADTAKAEQQARAALLRESRTAIEDRIGRAGGIAGGARLLDYTEGLDLLSSLRLGVETGILDHPPLRSLRELLFASQGAHLEMAAGHECDPLGLRAKRADMFRKQISNN